jgi:methylated-DNA-[protein]-cysteine S-methyltransferase
METTPMKLKAPALFDQSMRQHESLEGLLQSLLESNCAARKPQCTVDKPQAGVGLVRSSPVGNLLVCVSNHGIAMTYFLRSAMDLGAALARLRRDFELVADQAAAQRVGEELTRYMAGDEAALRSAIDLRLVRGTFQRHVLERLLEVGPGAILTYSSLAAWAGAPHASRAVGGAMHDNPIPVYVPCHRVVRSDLSLGGYGGGLDVKHKLLCIEGFSFTPAGLVAQDGAVWGNRSTQIFCRPGCRALAGADRTNAILLRDASRASGAGMRACRICCV